MGCWGTRWVDAALWNFATVAVAVSGCGGTSPGGSASGGADSSGGADLGGLADETDTGGGDDDDEDDEGADPGNDYSDDDYDYGCDAPTNECYTDADCPAAATCGSHPCGTACHHVPEMPECDQSLLETGSIGPLQGDIVSLAFLDASSPTGPVLAVGFADGGGVYSTEGQPVSELPLPEGASVREMVTGDFDGDGDEDLVVMSDAEARLLLGDGAGTFTAAASTGEVVGLTAIEALDFDGDGNLDLAVGSTAPVGSDAEEGVAIHAGDGAGGLAAPTLVLPVRTNDLARGEFDGTSPEDLVVAVGGNNGSYAPYGVRDRGSRACGPQRRHE